MRLLQALMRVLSKVVSGAVGVHVALACAELEADAALLAQTHGDTGAYAVRFAAALEGGGVDPGYEVDDLWRLRGRCSGLDLGGGGGGVSRQNCRFHLRGGDGNVLGLDGGALDGAAGAGAALLGGADVDRDADANGGAVVGSALLALAPRLCRKVAASAVALSMPPLASFVVS